MNFLHKCKRSDGFTLVELIVVIAILAILAGVAVPAYTGYIKKAEEAADNQLLGAVNTAFAAACLENAVDVNTLTDGSVTASVVGGKVVSVSKYNDAFQRYYAGNENAAFKQFTGLVFKGGNFVNSEGGYTMTFANGGTITFTQEQAAALQGSNYAEMGYDVLLNKVNDAASYASLLGSVQEIIRDTEFRKQSAEVLGIDTLKADWEAELEASVTQMAINSLGENYTQEEFLTAVNKIQTNAAVLYAANAAVTNQDKVTQITSQLGTAGFMDSIKETNETQSDIALSQAALGYGMYTAYLHSNKAPANADEMDEADILLALKDGDSGFAEYVNSEEGKQDMEAYLASMGMITSSANSQLAVEQLVVNGFNDPELIQLLKGALG